MGRGDDVKLPRSAPARNNTNPLRWPSLAAHWIEGRIDDLYSWIAGIIGELPRRLRRLGWSVAAVARGAIDLIRRLSGRDDTLRIQHILRGAGGWITILLFRLLDLGGVLEAVELLLRACTVATSLTPSETVLMQSVLGRTAVRYSAVRICTAGIMRPILRLNGGRAFTIAHTICMPERGPHCRQEVAILLHEMVHVLQYEWAGGAYIAEAIRAQQTEGYGYGGAQGLCTGSLCGKRYLDYNREQQAQIVQDYFVLRQRGDDVSEYEPYLREVRQDKA